MKCKHPVAKRVWQGDNMICNECNEVIDTRKPKQEPTDLFGEDVPASEETREHFDEVEQEFPEGEDDCLMNEFTAGEETNEVGGLADHSASVPEVSEGVVTREVRRLAIPLEPDQLAVYRAEVERLTKLIEGGSIVSEVECRTEYIRRIRRCDTGAVIEETPVDVKEAFWLSQLGQVITNQAKQAEALADDLSGVTKYAIGESQEPAQDEAGASVDVEQEQENTITASEPTEKDDGLVPCPPTCGEEGCPYEGGRGPAACGGMQR